MGRKDRVLGCEQEEGSDHRQVLDGIFLGIKEDSEEIIVGTPVGCVVCRTVKRRLRADAADPVFFNSIRGTPRRLLPDDEPREPREQPLRRDVRPVHTDIPLPTNTEPAKPRRVYIRNSVELARYGYTPGCIGCEAAMIQGPSRDHTEQCRTRIIQAMSSDADLSARVKEAHERMPRSASDAEPNMKKVIFAEHTTVPVSPTDSMPHKVSAPVAHGGSSSSSASLQITPTVQHVKLDDGDEHIGSKKLTSSEPGSLPSSAPMSADANLLSEDMRVECLLDRFERERVANKSNDPLLSRIAGWVHDEQFLEVAGLDGPARCRVAYELLKLEQSQNGVHIADTFSQPKTATTPSRMGLTPGLLFDMSRSCWNLDAQANAEGLCEYLQTDQCF